MVFEILSKKGASPIAEVEAKNFKEALTIAEATYKRVFGLRLTEHPKRIPITGDFLSS